MTRAISSSATSTSLTLRSPNEIEEIAGKAKEKLGAATGDESLERQGEMDQSKANLKQAGEKVKDAFKN